MDYKTLSLAEIETIAYDGLIKAGAEDKPARSLAIATRETEADGVSSHGLAYIPIYAEHVKCGKVDGAAIPVIEMDKPSLVRVNAKNGFAHPAIDLGFAALCDKAKQNGMAGLGIYQSYNCGVLGYHTKRLARAGFIGIGFTNAPASIAPSGGAKPVFGTNPFSIAVPDGAGGAAIVIDQSASTIAKSEIMKHAREGKPIPHGWALDHQGQPTSDPDEALKGSMVPAGGYKGAGVALMVEIMAAALTGANLGTQASPFSGPKGGPPATGQFFIAITPDDVSGGAFTSKINQIIESITGQDGAHLPGQGRQQKYDQAQQNGVKVSTAILDKIAAID